MVRWSPEVREFLGIPYRGGIFVPNDIRGGYHLKQRFCAIDEIDSGRLAPYSGLELVRVFLLDNIDVGSVSENIVMDQ